MPASPGLELIEWAFLMGLFLGIGWCLGCGLITRVLARLG